MSHRKTESKRKKVANPDPGGHQKRIVEYFLKKAKCETNVSDQILIQLFDTYIYNNYLKTIYRRYLFTLKIWTLIGGEQKYHARD